MHPVLAVSMTALRGRYPWSRLEENPRAAGSGEP